MKTEKTSSKKSGTIILTGWGTGHAWAAAVALQKHPAAEVSGASKRRLAEKVGGIVDCHEPGQIDNLLILGIPLGFDPHSLRQQLIVLNRMGTKCAWFSVYPPGDEQSIIGSTIEWHIADRPGPLAEFVADSFSLTRQSPGVRRIFDAMGGEVKGAKQQGGCQAAALFEAASSRYRRFRDSKAYPKAIRTVAGGQALSSEQQSMIEEYLKYGSREFRGGSQATARVWQTIEQVAPEDRCRVLITGETGVGKESVAYLIHAKSPRAGEPFIPFNCADLSPQLAESRLFGHEKGAFTGAHRQRRGAFELAEGGTLFLDEVAELSPNAQAGLLRVLEENRFYRLGGEQEVEVDVRIIAATNRDLLKMMRDGEFRSDLYYRLNTVELHIPPLRERADDIRPIADSILRKQGRPVLNDRQIAQLLAYPWPGNVRELISIIERARIFNQSDYGPLLPASPNEGMPNDQSLATMTALHCQQIYAQCKGNKAQAAKRLGISVNTLKKHLATKTD